MMRATVVRRDALCNVARGLGRIAMAMLPVQALSSLTGAAAAAAASQATPMGAPIKTQYSEGGGGVASSADLPDAIASDLSRSTQAYQQSKDTIRYRAVPSTQVSRAAGFGSLFMQLAWEKATGATPAGAILSPAGHQRIVDTLCRMRGAVLKLGQMLSIQDDNIVPAHVTALFERVRDQAFAMPAPQLEATLRKEFHDRPNWRAEIFEKLDDTPIAAASIGQVHHGTVRAGVVPASEMDDAAFHVPVLADGVARNAAPVEVAVKVQYPGVAKSIDSDVANLKVLMSVGVLPPGMFVDSILKELRNELSVECQYTIEGAKQQRYRQLVRSDPALRDAFYVPRVFASLSSNQVLVSEFVRGVPVDQLAARGDTPIAFRNYISEKMMTLTLSELFRWRFMQTDPNYANFLYDVEQRRLNLLDFGAAREYDVEFVRDYLDVVAAAARQDRETIIEKSIRLGFLTGREVKEMMDAHVASVELLGKPFRDRERPFDFSTENLPMQIKGHVPTMVKLRLRPPPTPVYSLHRRLSGTILLATKFGATIPSGKIFWDMYDEVHGTF